MPEVEDIIGKRFGGWVVQSRQDALISGRGRNGKHKKVSKWICQCDCGTVKSFYRFQLTGKRSSRWCKSCSRTKDSASTPAHSVMRDYQRAAFNRGIEWGLSFEEFVHIAASECFYTGRKPSQVRTLLSGKTFRFNGIDRLDSSKGYILGNCVACCSEVNRAKMDLRVSEFLSLVEEIHRHTGGFHA